MKEKDKYILRDWERQKNIKSMKERQRVIKKNEREREKDK